MVVFKVWVVFAYSGATFGSGPGLMLGCGPMHVIQRHSTINKTFRIHLQHINRICKHYQLWPFHWNLTANHDCLWSNSWSVPSSFYSVQCSDGEGCFEQEIYVQMVLTYSWSNCSSLLQKTAVLHTDCWFFQPALVQDQQCAEHPSHLCYCFGGRRHTGSSVQRNLSVGGSQDPQLFSCEPAREDEPLTSLLLPSVCFQAWGLVLCPQRDGKVGEVVRAYLCVPLIPEGNHIL